MKNLTKKLIGPLAALTIAGAVAPYFLNDEKANATSKQNTTPQYSSQNIQPSYDNSSRYPKEISGKLAHYPTQIPVTLTNDIELLATLAFEEAKFCSKEEKIAVMYTAINRLKEGRDKSLLHVILKGNQYSCFNSYNPHKGKKIKIETNKWQKWEEAAKEWNECMKTAYQILNGEISDPTSGATHYFNPKKVNPGWQHQLESVKTQNTVHKFYKNPTA